MTRDAPRPRRADAGMPGGHSRLLTPRLAVLFLAGCMLFGTPVLWPVAPGARILGLPLLFVYLFVAWGAFIAALAWLLESGTRGAPPRREEDAP